MIKSKLQTDSLDPAKRQYRGIADCAAKTWRAQGWRGFTGGLAPTLLRCVDWWRPSDRAVWRERRLIPRSPFANGATFVAFELAMRAMN